MKNVIPIRFFFIYLYIYIYIKREPILHAQESGLLCVFSKILCILEYLHQRASLWRINFSKTTLTVAESTVSVTGLISEVPHMIPVILPPKVAYWRVVPTTEGRFQFPSYVPTISASIGLTHPAMALSIFSGIRNFLRL